MEYKDERFGTIEITEMTQGQLEEFSVLMPEIAETKAVVYRGAAVVSAGKAGFLKPAMNETEVKGLKPAKVRWIYEKVVGAIAEATDISPLS